MKRTLLMILATSLLSLAASGDAACQPATANSPGGTIAYVREGKEIRLIAPDGTNDRRLWAHPRPDLADTQGIHSLAWRRDGRVLGFSSGHEAVYSLFHADIYSIRPDGSGLRKVTNPPSRAEFARFPKGTVRVTVRNAAAEFSLFIIYVAGSPEPQSATEPMGSSQ